MSNVLNTYGSPIEKQMALDTQMEALPVSERKRVLIINNEPMLLELIADCLELYIGCETTTVEDSREALQVLKQEQELPDLIVDTASLHNLNVSSYELLSFIKQNERTREIPFLSFTYSDPNRTKLLYPGIDAVIGQPFEVKELLVQLKSLLKLEA